MKKVKLIGLLAGIILAAGSMASAAPAAAKTTVPEVIPTVAVLPFDSRTQQENVGSSVSELLTAKLSESGDFELADRSKINEVMTELKLSASGLVEKDTQTKIGQMLGAKILVTGSVFKEGDKHYVVAKVIGVETTRVIACSVSGQGRPVEMVPELSVKVINTIRKNVAKLLPPVRNRATVEAELKELVGNSGSGKSVYVKVNETTAQSIDPAAQTELQKLLQALGFTVVEQPDQAEYRIIGEGLAENSGNFKGFSSATARLEIRLYAKDKLLASDRQVETVAGVAPEIAAKDALAQAALVLAKRIVPKIK